MRHHKHRPKRRRGKRKSVIARHDEQRKRAVSVESEYGEKGMRMCGRKLAYRTRSEALVAASRNARYTVALRAYYCPICGMWHLTSKV